MKFDFRSYIHKSAKYFVVGLITTSIFIGGIYALTEFFGIYYLLSNVIAFTLATVVGFLGQKYFTFKNHGKNYLGQLIHFTAVAILGLGINTGTIYLFEEVFQFGYMLGAVFSSGIVFMIKFPLNNYFTFKPVLVESEDSV